MIGNQSQAQIDDRACLPASNSKPGQKWSAKRSLFIAATLLASVLIGFCFSFASNALHPFKMALFGYCLSIVIEIPILMFALSPRHKLSDKLLSGLWLTGCTYPIVVWFFPCFIENSFVLTAARESYAVVVECLLFWVAFNWMSDCNNTQKNQSAIRDSAAITVANMVSFMLGEYLKFTGTIWVLLELFSLA